ARDSSPRARPRRPRRARRRLARAALSGRRRPRERAGGGGDRDGHGGGHRGLCLRARGGAGMTVNPSGWRPEAPMVEAGSTLTYTGNRALMLEEPLIFEIAGTETTGVDRKSTRLNSSHVKSSYADFCLKKKTARRRPART